MLAEILGLVVQLNREVRALRASLPARVNAPEPNHDDVLTVAQFSQRIGRSRDWVYDQIRCRRLRVLPLGKPYQLAAVEVLRLQNGGVA